MGFENASYGIIILRNFQFLIADVNREVEWLTGYKRGELLQRSFIDLFGPVEKEKVLSYFKEVLKKGEANTDSYSLLKKDGTFLEVDLSIKRIDLGNDSFYQVVFRDLMEQRKLEKKIMESKRDLEAIFDGIRDQISIQTPDYQILRVNRAVIENHRTTYKELIGKKCYKAYYQRSLPCERCPVAVTVETKQPTSSIMKILEENTTLRIFSYPILDEERNLVSVIEHVQDITEELRLQKIERLFEKILETLPLGAIVIDKEGRVLMCNKAQEIISEISRDSLLGKNLFKDPLPIDLKPWQEMAKDFLNNSAYKVKDIDLRPEKKKILSITHSSLADEDGDSKNFIFLSADITNEKRIEEQTIQSEKMTAIGQLVTSLAHQIRNPLAIIGSSAQCCIEKVKRENGLKKHFEIIYRNVQNANKIISDLLDLSKPKTLELKQSDINQLLREICSLLKIDFSKNRIRISKWFERGLPKIICDKESLRQVFFNLLMNSKQAMPKGGVISITTRYSFKDQMVEIIIEDTGKGIPKEDLPNIFNPYFTTKEKGTGLGLSIVHRIISDHHGKILPESEEGKGTKISIFLPIQPKN